MQIKHQKLLHYLAIPVLAAIFYLALIFVYKKLGLPDSQAIIAWATKYYENYGYWVVLVGALCEGALFINWYLPGSIVVALGAVFARESGLNIYLMLLMVVMGFYSTALLNYLLGRFGWYHVFMKFGLKQPLEKVESRIKDKGLNILFTTYVHPNFGALAATAAGILRLDFLKFALYTFISIVLWNSLWTIVFYWFGAPLLKHVNWVILAGGVLVYFMFLKSFKKPSVADHLNVP